MVVAFLIASAAAGMADSIVGGTAEHPVVVADKVFIFESKHEQGKWNVRYAELREGMFLHEAFRTLLPGEKPVFSPVDERQAMLKAWKASGWSAEVKDEHGRKTTYYNFCVRPTAPPGKQFIESPDHLGQFDLHAAEGRTRITFDKVAIIGVQGETYAVTRLDGTQVQGPFATIDYRGADAARNSRLTRNTTPAAN